MTVTRSPILVTGTHRSGTTWVGRMLALSPYAHYVHEPFAPMNHRSWLRELPAIRFLHQQPHDIGPHASDLDRITALRPSLGPMLKRSRTPGDVLRAVEQVARAASARRRGARAIIKDPFALLSAEWIARRTDADVIVLVRHPAAFVSSIKRLGWRLDEQWLTSQDALMCGDLRRFRSVLDDAQSLDLIDHSILIWRALTAVATRLQDDHPDWTVMRYEDLAMAPSAEFERLFATVGLPWTDEIEDGLRRHNSASNPTDVDTTQALSTQRDSRTAIWTWRNRLSPDEIERIHHETRDVAARWYEGAPWWPHAVD